MSTSPQSTATISPCGLYRYDLWRVWDYGPYCMFIGLNPSTADATLDDPTIRRCRAFAQAWGYGALCMVNLFAFRATDPKVMIKAADPIGPENDSWLLKHAADAGLIVAAWGAHGVLMNRGKTVARMIPNLHCLKLTKDGAPGHPLYLRADSKPIPYVP